MSLEIRPVVQDELAEYVRLVTLSNGMSPQTPVQIRPEWTLAAFEDGKMASTYGAWPLIMRFNGGGGPTAGVTMVSTHPAYRRRGYLRAITKQHFEQLHAAGEQPIAALHATQAAIYHRFGYAVVATTYRYDLEPRFLQFHRPLEVRGSFQEVGRDDFPQLVELYRSFRADRTGYVHRGRGAWDAGMLAPPPRNGSLVMLVYYEDGEPKGYLIYASQPFDDFVHARMNIVVRDIVWLTPGAYQAAWNHLQAMDLVQRIVWDRVPPDDPLPHLMLEPRMLLATAKDGLMARPVDVDRALPLRRYAAEGSLVFDVHDEMCPWNAGRWKLETSGDETTVRRTKEPAQLAMPINTLAALAFGQVSASEAARMGRLDVLDHDALGRWDVVLRTMHHPSCADGF